MKDTRTFFELSSEMAGLEDTLYNNGGELTPELETMLNDTEESIKKKADGYDSVLRIFKYRSDNLGAEIKRLQDKKRAQDNAIKRIKEHIIDVMQRFGMTKVEGEKCRISLGKSKSLEVDETAMFERYEGMIQKLQEKLPPYLTVEVKVSKTVLKDAFKDTDILPEGTKYIESPSLRIR